MRKLGLVLAVLLAVCAAEAKTEFGKLNAAEFRIDVPDNWNHSLVVYYHGYRTTDKSGVFPQDKPLNPALAVFTNAGFALIQSGYSQSGWALEQAVPETEALRRYFSDKYEKPKATYVAGHSMGGMLTVLTIEQSPEIYAGGLDLCGAVSDTPNALSHAFDLRVLFDYYFPGVLPNPAHVPADYEMSEELGKKVADLLQAKPQDAAVLEHLRGIHNDKDLTDDLLFATWVLKDIERRAGGNPFDNRDAIYTGTSDDNALNDGVQRYAADAGALAYLQRYYMPTGRLTRPVLAIHTTYDPIVSPSVVESYALLARTAGSGDLFVGQYVKHDGHCNITPEEIERGLHELIEWKEKGKKPAPGGMK